MTREERLAFEERKVQLLREREAQRQQADLQDVSGTTGISSLYGKDIQKMQPTPIAPEDRGFVDTAAGDFLGNLVYGFGETFVVPTVADIASGGDLSASFGSDPWVDESLAGKLGYALGTGAGLLTGIGAVGKGLGTISKLSGAGIKAASKKVATEIAEKGGVPIGEEVTTNLIKTGRQAIKEGLDAELNAIKPWSYFTRRALKTNPLGNANIVDKASRTMQEALIKTVPGIKPNQVSTLSRLALSESGQSLTKTFGHSIKAKLIGSGINPKVAQFAGDMAYEATLLATWDTVVGEAGEIAANIYDVTEEDAPGLFKPWYSRALHGAVLGSILAPIRYIPGGKAVQFGKSGMVADIGHIGRMFRNRFRNSERMSQGQLQAALKTIWVEAGKPTTFLPNVKGFSIPLLNAKGKLKPEQLSNLKNAWREVRKQVFPHRDSTGSMNPGLIAKLGAEIAEDGLKSFTRASVGSLAMNGQMYWEMKDQLGTEEYPWDKLVADQYIGMLYMKRGKTHTGSKKMPRFFEQTGMDGTGGEINSFVKSMDILGYKPEILDNVSSMAANVDDMKALQNTNKLLEENSPELKKINDKVRDKAVTGEEFVGILDVDLSSPNPGAMQGWAVHGHKHIIDLTARIRAEKDPTKKAEMQGELESFQEQFIVAQAIEKEGLIGSGNVITKPMTAEESMIFIQDLNSTRIDGRVLTADTVVDVLQRKRQTGVGEINNAIRQDLMAYLSDSFNALGYSVSPETGNVDSMGRPIIHSTVVDLLESIKRDNYRQTEKGEAENPYADAASSLHNTIVEAEMAGYLRIASGEGGQQYRGSVPTEVELSNLKAVYNTNLETMHNTLFSEPGTNWREIVPNYSQEGSGFLAVSYTHLTLPTKRIV